MDVEKVIDARDLVPTFTRNNHGVPPRSLVFNATTPSSSVAATLERARNTDTTTKELMQASVNLANANVVYAAPLNIISTPTPCINVPANMHATAASAIPRKGTQAYASMHELLAMHQEIIAIEVN